MQGSSTRIYAVYYLVCRDVRTVDRRPPGMADMERRANAIYSARGRARSRSARGSRDR